MRVYLGLGSNLGSREEIITTAIDMIKKRIGNVVSLSAFYSTDPSGFESDHQFLNAACGVDTNLVPIEVLNQTEAIERELGRVSKSLGKVYHDRSIDIDILLCENWVIRSERLTVPHPLMHERMFVLEPLAEIASDAIHPLLGKDIQALKEELLSRPSCEC